MMIRHNTVYSMSDRIDQGPILAQALTFEMKLIINQFGQRFTTMDLDFWLRLCVMSMGIKTENAKAPGRGTIIEYARELSW